MVGAGTPAAKAKLKPGDVIVTVNGTKLLRTDARGYAEHAEQLLSAFTPGDTVKLKVRPGPAPADSPGAGSTAYSLTLIHRPMEVIRPEHSDLQDDTSSLQPYSFMTTFSEINSVKTGSLTEGFSRDEIYGLPSLLESNWEPIAAEHPDEVAFRFVLEAEDLKGAGVEGRLAVVKRYRLAQTPAEGDDQALGNGYHLTMSIEVENLGGKPALVSLDQRGPTGLPLEGWWYLRKLHPTDFSSTGARDVAWRSEKGAYKLHRNAVIVHNQQQEPPDPTPLFSDEPTMRFVAGDGHYFLAAMMPDQRPDAGYSEDKYRLQYGEALVVGDIPEDKARRSTTDVTFRVISRPFRVPAGESYEQRYVVFIGPKDPEILRPYGLEDTVVFGWTIFGYIARPLIWFLDKIYLVVRNYGIAIILLTVLVRLAVLPIGRKQAMNAAMMQQLAPEMKKIAEKYKDMEQRAKAQKELFAKHDYNPFGGCGLLFLQMPIFFALYKSLSVSINLRQASLIPGLKWCSNLAGPDMFWHWEPYLPQWIAGETGYLGPYLNILPLVTIVLFIVHQKLFTPRRRTNSKRCSRR